MESHGSNEAADDYRLSSRSSSVSSYSDNDDEEEGNEGLVENLKEALAERDRKLQLQKLNSEEVIPSSNDHPPPLPPKLGRSNIGAGGDDEDDEQTRIIDFGGGNNKYPNRKRSSKNKRSHSLEYQRKANGQKAVDKLYRRSALVSLHPVSSREEPITAYDPLKLVDTDEDDINNLVIQANTLEMRPYNEQQDGEVEVLYPSFQHQSQPKKNLKSAIPEVFSKLAPQQDHHIDDDNFDDEPTENFEAIRSHTLPSQQPNRMKKRGVSPPREKMDMADVWPSDITDFDSVSTSDHEQPKNLLNRHDDDDESYAYDTVADQTDDFDAHEYRKGGGDTKIVCDKYVLCGNMNEKLHNTYPKRLHFKTTHKDRPGLESIAIALTDPSSGNPRHIMTSQNRGTFPAASRSRKMKRTTSLDSRNKNKESDDDDDMTSRWCDDVEPSPTQVRLCLGDEKEDYQINLIPTSSNTINLNIQSINELQVQPPPLITAVKHISSPVKEEVDDDDVIMKHHQPADRVVDFYADEEISGEFNPDHEIGRAYSFNIGKNILLEKQQQLILQQLKELNDLQKQQLGQQQRSEGLEPTAPSFGETTAPSFGVIQPIVVTTHHIEETTPQINDVQTNNNKVVQVENPLAGRPLGEVVTEQEPVVVDIEPVVHGSEPVVHGGDSGIDLRTNYHGISTSSSTTSSCDSEIDIYTSPNQQLKRAKEVEKIRRWYRRNYLKPRCCFSCLSVFICIINLIFFLIGTSLLGLASYGVYDLLLDRINDPLLALVDPMFAMAIFGFIIFVATLSAMVGFCKGKLFLIKFFGWFLIFTCLLFSVGGIVFWIYKAEFPVFLSGYVFRRLIQNYGGDHRIISAFTLDQIQQNFKCCGINKQVSWNLNSNFPCQNSTCILPDSCCLDQVSCTSDHPAVFNVTCMDEMSTFVDNYNGIIAGVWGCLMLLVIIEFICTHYMIREVMYRLVIKKQIKIIVRDLQDSCESEDFTKSRKSRRKRKKKKQKKKKKNSSYINPVYH